jgi:hypothetical protein
MVQALEKVLSLGLLDELAKTPRNQLLPQFELEHPKLRSMEFQDLLYRRREELALWETMSHVEKDQKFEELVS